MTTDFSDPHAHARAFEAAAMVSPKTLEALLLTVCIAVRDGWTYDMLREQFRVVLSGPIVLVLPSLTFETLAGHVVEHDDPWEGLIDVLAVMRGENTRAGGDDRQLALTVAGVVAMLVGSIPFAAGETP